MRSRRRSLLAEAAKPYLHRWLELRGSGQGALICRVNKSGVANAAESISAHQFWRLLRDLSELAEVDTIRPHDMRRYFVTSLLSAGHDVLKVSRLVGHAKATTTAIYDRRDPDDLRHVVDDLALPTFDELDELDAAEIAESSGILTSSGGLS